MESMNLVSTRSPAVVRRVRGRQQWPLERLFLLTGFFFGLLFLVTTPPFQVADETRHFARAYQLSEQFLHSVGCISPPDRLPKSLVEAMEQMHYMRFNPDAKTTLAHTWALMSRPLLPDQRAGYAETSAYTVVSYLPQVALIVPFRLAQINAVITLYAARLVALLFWLGLTYWSIRKIPVAKHLLFFIALLPMTIYQAGSLSADCITLSLSFLLVAWYLRLVYETTPVSWQQLVFVGGIGVLLTASKLVYAPLIGLHFLIRPAKFRSNLTYVFSFAFTVLACVFAFLLAYSDLLTPLLEPERAAMAGSATGVTAYPQLNFLLENPTNGVRMLTATGIKYGRTYMDGFVAFLGWSGASLPSYLNVVTVLMLWLAAFSSNSYLIIRPRRKLLLIGISVLVTLLICLVLCTDLSLNSTPTFLLRGIQGRYFTPLAMLIGLLAANHWAIRRRYGRYVLAAVFPFLLFLLVNAFCILVSHYYLI